MRNLFSFSPKVDEVGSYYTVTGINLKSLDKDLRNNFGTSVIFTKLITRINNGSFKIHKFFILEFAWILDHLTNQKSQKVVNRYYVGIHKYKQLYDEIKQKTWITTTFEKHPQYDINKAVSKFVYTPYPDQRDFLEQYSQIKFGFQLRGCLLDAAVGSGKSISSLMWSEMISAGALFLVVPKGLVTSPWLNEINKVYKNPPKVWTTLDGTNIMDHLDAKIFIIHTEQIRTGEWDLAVKLITKNGKLPAKVVVDESHNYNEHKSAQTIGLINFCTNPFISDVLLMSGTPIKAQGRETYALFAIIDKFFDANVRDNFLKMYGRDNSYLNEMLAHRLGRIKYTISAITEMTTPPEPEVIKISFPGIERFTLDAIREDMMIYITDRVKFYNTMMPEYSHDWSLFVKDYQQRTFNDPTEQKRIARYLEIVKRFQTHGYNNFTDSELSKFAGSVEKDIEYHLKGDELKYFRHIKSAVKYVGLKIRGEALGNVLGKARMEAVRAVIQHANLPALVNSVKKKTLVYTSYVDVIKELVTYFEQEGMQSTNVYGNNSNEIDKIVTEFANNPDINPLITTFETLREGKPMIMANQIILMNAPFRSYELTQVIARIYRRGQDEECFVKLLDLDTGSKENITSRSIDIMSWSEEMVNQLLGGGKLPGSKGMMYNPAVVGGMESEHIWDIPSVNTDLDIDQELTVKRAVPKSKINRLIDVF